MDDADTPTSTPTLSHARRSEAKTEDDDHSSLIGVIQYKDEDSICFGNRWVRQDHSCQSFVFDKLKGDYDCGAFVPIGQNPDLKKVFKDILIDLDRQRYLQFSTTVLDERQLIDELRGFFLYWETIRLAFDDDNNCGGRIIITTRKLEIATRADEVYKLQHLTNNLSWKLFYKRISGDEIRHVDKLPDEISNKILKKCGGIPLAIITMASLLVGKPRDKWPELYKSIGFGCKDYKEEGNIVMRILSFSYYDMPSHLRTRLLYLTAFLEDSVIRKDVLVWMWVAEGFVHEEQGIWLFETGEGYFNDLINRSLIQSMESNSGDGTILGCRVHDMVLNFIRSMAREENFLTILENDHLTRPLRSNISQHNRTIDHAHQASIFDDLRKVRSFCAHGYLSLRKTLTDKVPEEIGVLRFLQTLDLWGSIIVETPSSSSLPTQLVCLRITFDDTSDNAAVASVERLTSLEELSIGVIPWNCRNRRWLVKELGNLRELRVLNATIFTNDKECKKELVESLRHLHKLQHLEIEGYAYYNRPMWETPGLMLPSHLRHLAVHGIILSKLPPCINPLCVPNLSHLHLSLGAMHEQDLKIIGSLPELISLEMELLWHSATIRNIISDIEAVYFPKLRCFRLARSMVLFVANKEDKSVSFHLWEG
ncbi:LOW QUALITY PROTEIN: hypothetical protein U9M48_000290 [Paspalum notatum var. saurae]|uniref:NB-ARC domain-containing protein n=1 Tax=Paspalum notatum var. saurae TaxID=547442 RepID=A0AAQ3PGT0_PASNO